MDSGHEFGCNQVIPSDVVNKFETMSINQMIQENHDSMRDFPPNSSSHMFESGGTQSLGSQAEQTQNFNRNNYSSRMIRPSYGFRPNQAQNFNRNINFPPMQSFASGPNQGNAFQQEPPLNFPPNHMHCPISRNELSNAATATPSLLPHNQRNNPECPPSLLEHLNSYYSRSLGLQQNQTVPAPTSGSFPYNSTSGGYLPSGGYSLPPPGLHSQHIQNMTQAAGHVPVFSNPAYGQELQVLSQNHPYPGTSTQPDGCLPLSGNPANMQKSRFTSKSPLNPEALDFIPRSLKNGGRNNSVTDINQGASTLSAGRNCFDVPAIFNQNNFVSGINQGASTLPVGCDNFPTLGKAVNLQKLQSQPEICKSVIFNQNNFVSGINQGASTLPVGCDNFPTLGNAVNLQKLQSQPENNLVAGIIKGHNDLLLDQEKAMRNISYPLKNISVNIILVGPDNAKHDLLKCYLSQYGMKLQDSDYSQGYETEIFEGNAILSACFYFLQNIFECNGIIERESPKRCILVFVYNSSISSFRKTVDEYIKEYLNYLKQAKVFIHLAEKESEALVETNVEDINAKDTDAKATTVKDTAIKATVVMDTVAKTTTVKDTSVKGTNAKATAVKDPYANSNTVKDSDPKFTAVKGTNAKATAINSLAVKGTVVKAPSIEDISLSSFIDNYRHVVKGIYKFLTSQRSGVENIFKSIVNSALEVE